VRQRAVGVVEAAARERLCMEKRRAAASADSSKIASNPLRTSLRPAEPTAASLRTTGTMATPAASIDGKLETENGTSVLTHGPLNVARILATVGDDAAGATAAFVGTTRSSFKGG
jgi:hypothetical protein